MAIVRFGPRSRSPAVPRANGSEVRARRAQGAARSGAGSRRPVPRRFAANCSHGSRQVAARCRLLGQGFRSRASAGVCDLGHAVPICPGCSRSGRRSDHRRPEGSLGYPSRPRCPRPPPGGGIIKATASATGRPGSTPPRGASGAIRGSSRRTQVTWMSSLMFLAESVIMLASPASERIGLAVLRCLQEAAPLASAVSAAGQPARGMVLSPPDGAWFIRTTTCATHRRT